MNQLGPEHLGLLLWMSLISLAFAPLLSLLDAVVLRTAAKWAEGIKLQFGDAYFTALLIYLAGLLLGTIINVAYVSLGGVQHFGYRSIHLVLILIGCLLQSEIISLRHDVTFGHGFVILLFKLLIYFLAGLCLALIVVVLALFAAIHLPKPA